MENPLHRPFMTSLGIGGIVFLCMMVVAGYIDVLHITPKGNDGLCDRRNSGGVERQLCAAAAVQQKERQ